jgi:GxxExxY protein
MADSAAVTRSLVSRHAVPGRRVSDSSCCFLFAALKQFAGRSSRAPRVLVLQRLNRVNLTDGITSTIIGAAIEVHRVVGPGVLESAYELAMCIELQARGVAYTRQVRCPILYRGHYIGDYRLDLMVDDAVAVEIKSIDSIRPVHVAQMLTYLRASAKQTGLIINFNEAYLKNGIRRVILRAPHHGENGAAHPDASPAPLIRPDAVE